MHVPLTLCVDRDILSRLPLDVLQYMYFVQQCAAVHGIPCLLSVNLGQALAQPTGVVLSVVAMGLQAAPYYCAEITCVALCSKGRQRSPEFETCVGCASRGAETLVVLHFREQTFHVKGLCCTSSH